jgi:hypothetical protein
VGPARRTRVDDLGERVVVAVVVEYGGSGFLRGGADEIVDDWESLGAGRAMGERAHRVLGGPKDGRREWGGPQG